MKSYSVWFGDVWMDTYMAWSEAHAIEQCCATFGYDSNYTAMCIGNN